MVSSILTVRPETSIIYWEQKQEPINVELALSLLTRLQHSVAIVPSNATNHLLIARLYELLAFQEDKAVNATHVSDAIESYKKAILHQPSWDIAWARLAALNSKLNNDSQAINSLQRAIVLGPYENHNQRIIIPIIIKYWNTTHFLEHNNRAIKKLFSHALTFTNNHTWLLNRVLESKNISLLRFTAPLIKHQEQQNRFNQFLIDEPQLKLVTVRKHNE